MPAYITSLGKCLPGEPIPSDQLDDYLGAVGGGRGARVRDLVIKNSGIRTRHYAIDSDQATTMTNADLAVASILDATTRVGLPIEDLGLIAVGTTLGDLLAPTMASMVHGMLGGGPCEVLGTGGFCCAG